MFLPVGTEPVKLIASTSGERTIASPTTEPRPITRLNTPGGSDVREMISASAHTEPGTRSAGLITTQLPNASAGAIFHAGIAIGKFQGVIMPTTPTGSRVISTSMPGRTDGTSSPCARMRFAREELEDVAGARGFADALGPGLAFLAREQGAELFLAREDLVADLVEDVGALLHAGERPLGETLRARPRWPTSACARSACAYSPITSDVFDGLTFGVALAPSTHCPLM